MVYLSILVTTLDRSWSSHARGLYQRVAQFPFDEPDLLDRGAVLQRPIPKDG